MKHVRFYAWSDELFDLLGDYEAPFSLAGASSVHCLLPDWRLGAYDCGWVDFARGNGGDLSKLGLGVSVMAAMPTVLKGYYRRVYRHCLQREAVWRHHYQCSSPEIFRVFEEVVVGLPDRRGLLVANFLVTKEEISGRTAAPDEERFVNPLNGKIGQCASCRWVVDPHHRQWWRVPEWVRWRPAKAEDDLCPTCFHKTYHSPGVPA